MVCLRSTAPVLGFSEAISEWNYTIYPRTKKKSAQDVKAAIIQALQAGLDGIILSRQYSEMRLANLGGAGAAISESGLP